MKTLDDALTVCARENDNFYPCEREQDLATYCNNVLGLRKSSQQGRSDPNGTPPGYEVARAMCARSTS